MLLASEQQINFNADRAVVSVLGHTHAHTLDPKGTLHGNLMIEMCLRYD